MRKSVFLSLSLIGGILLTLFLVSGFSALASTSDVPLAPPQVITQQDLQRTGLDVQAIEQPLEYRATVDRLGRITPDLIPSIDPASITKVGIPAPGEILTYYYTTTPASTDGEGVDAYMFIAPGDWEILAISAAPAGNNAPCPGTVDQDFSNTPGQAIAFWGRADMLPGNPADFEPIAPEDRSGCGPWVADGAHAYSFWVRVQIPNDYATCPGAPHRVGIAWDTQHTFTWKPERLESMTMYLYGDHAGSGGTSVTSWKIQLQQACPVPVVDLQKTVGSAGQCPGSSTDHMDVISGTVVEYCYKLYNLNSLVTLTYHTVEDDLLGEYQVTQLLPGGSWTYMAIPQVVTGTEDALIVNTAYYTGTTSTGFGQAPQDDPEGSFSITEYMDSDMDTASVTIIDRYLMFMPILFHNDPPPPRAGYWAGLSEEFYVKPGSGYVDKFSVYITVPGCGDFKITNHNLVPIQNDSFAFTGAFYGQGTFNTYQTASGTEGLDNYYLAACDTYISSEGNWNWTAFWSNNSQPTFQEVTLTPLSDPFLIPAVPAGTTVERVER
ncbi:MAG: hypothetical protein JW862_13995 [Anaerolineales bacterium]|nr:hypothetical protein [Anaerolineales bacterium]